MELLTLNDIKRDKNLIELWLRFKKLEILETKIIPYWENIIFYIHIHV